MNKKNALIDVPVLVIFWARPDTFRQVFNRVKEARPTQLFLYQDGIDDEKYREGLNACRDIANEIDWKCEVFRNYQEHDLGACQAEYLAQKWMFEYVDKGIILEDDDVPSLSFFKFCEELLERYENDTRIYMIAGLNHEGESEDVEADYFFTENISLWGWATWKRVVDTWDENYRLINDSLNMRLYENLISGHRMRKVYYSDYKNHASLSVPNYESIVISNMLMNSGLSIVPTKNMIRNIGVTNLSTNYTGGIELVPHEVRKIFMYPAYEIDFPLRHPQYIVDHVKYKERVYEIMAYNHPIKRFLRKFESLYLKIRYGDFKGLKKSICRMFNR